MINYKSLIILIFIANFCFGQNTPTTSAKDSSTNNINKKLDDILTKLKSLEKNEVQPIGTLTFYAQKFPVYKSGVQIGSVQIDSISMVIQEGLIIDVKVFKNKYNYPFINKQAPISLTDSRFNSDKEDYLFNNIGESIIIQELFLLNLRNDYISEDTVFTFTSKNKKLDLYRNVGINTVLDIRIYTDALGLLDEKGNGLVQTDIKFKQVLHRRNLVNMGGSIFKYFTLNVNASKFDSKFKYLDTLKYSRPKFIQQSFINADLGFNIINGKLVRKSAQTYYLDAGGGLNVGRVSKHNDSITTNITSPYYFLEFGGHFKISDNIGSAISLRVFQNFIPQNKFISDNYSSNFFKINAEIYYNPFGNKANRMFGRVNYTLSPIKSEQKDNFLQLQLGYSVLLTKLIDKK